MAGTAGRPRKAPDARRDAVVFLRLTPAERAQVEDAAQAHGITAAELGRRLLCGYRLPALATEQRAQAHKAAILGGLLNNLNQLTRAANAGRLLPASVTDLADRIRLELDAIYGSGADSGRP